MTRLTVEPRGLPVEGDAVTARCVLGHAGRTSVRTREELRASDGALLATAEATLALTRALDEAGRAEVAA